MTGIYLAPMAGITDAAFRQICIEQGAHLTYTEMVSAKGLKYGSVKTASLISFAANEKRLGIQLFTSDILALTQSIELLYKKYGSRIALFDINMGCPAPKITDNGEGCALMKNPSLAETLIKAAVGASPIPITVKFRKGWDEQSINAVSFAQMAEQAGASALAVHSRTRQQFYSGRADMRIIEQVKKAVRIPVIGNGDIYSAQDAVNMFDNTGCDAVMVARGSLGNPFIFCEIRSLLDNGTPSPTITNKEKAKMLLRHATLCCAYKGEALAMLQMRKHAAWYFKSMRRAAKLRSAAGQLCFLDDLKILLEPFFND